MKGMKPFQKVIFLLSRRFKQNKKNMTMRKFAFSVLIAAVSFLFIQQAQAQKYAQGTLT
jgi:dipeptide/tripeptide permease